MNYVIDHNNKVYQRKWMRMSEVNKHNGAYYYSHEIVENIIPNVKTDRPWITIKAGKICVDRAIYFIHNNLHPEHYEHLINYKDLILVCGVPETCEKVKHLGTPIYLPLSIDVDYVKQFKLPKEERHGSAFIGRPSKRKYEGITIPDDVDIIEGIKREDMLPVMAKYETVYAVGRCAIEAKALGCKLKAYDPRYPKVSFWKVLDNKDAAEMLQQRLNEIDGK